MIEINIHGKKVPISAYEFVMLQSKRLVFPDQYVLNSRSFLRHVHDKIEAPIYKKTGSIVQIKADGVVYLEHPMFSAPVPIGEWRLLQRGEN